MRSLTLRFDSIRHHHAQPSNQTTWHHHHRSHANMDNIRPIPTPISRIFNKCITPAPYGPIKQGIVPDSTQCGEARAKVIPEQNIRVGDGVGDLNIALACGGILYTIRPFLSTWIPSLSILPQYRRGYLSLSLGIGIFSVHSIQHNTIQYPQSNHDPFF